MIVCMFVFHFFAFDWIYHPFSRIHMKRGCISFFLFHFYFVSFFFGLHMLPTSIEYSICSIISMHVLLFIPTNPSFTILMLNLSVDSAYSHSFYLFVNNTFYWTPPLTTLFWLCSTTFDSCVFFSFLPRALWPLFSLQNYLWSYALHSATFKHQPTPPFCNVPMTYLVSHSDSLCHFLFLSLLLFAIV